MRKQLLVMAEQIQLMRSLHRASSSASTLADSLIAETGTKASAGGDVAAMEAVVEASEALHPLHSKPPESALVQTAQPGPRVVPLTEGQRKMWIAAQMSDVANCAFNESASLVISGPLDIDRLVQSVITVLAEQEAFRYRFDNDGESQWVDERATFELPITDWSELNEVNRTARLDAWIDQESLTPFDLERGPLVRPQFFKLEARLHLFVIYCHHIIFDGFSSEILLRKITDAYSLVNDPACRSSSTVPYSDYVERATLVDRDESADSLAYWCSEFEGSVPAPLELPTDRPRNSRRAYRAGTVRRKLDATLSLSLRDTAKALNTSVFVLLLSCFQALLSRLSSQEDIVIAVPMAGQARLNLWTVGYCVNALPLRAAVGHDQPFVDLVRETHRKMLDAFDHQAAALGEIVSALRIERDPSRLPLAEVFFNYSSYFSGLAMNGCDVTPRENPRLAIFYDMFLNIAQWSGSLELDWQYRSDLFDSSTIERWVEHYLELLRGVVADSRQKVGELPLMSTDQLTLTQAMWEGERDDER